MVGTVKLFIPVGVLHDVLLIIKQLKVCEISILFALNKKWPLFPSTVYMLYIQLVLFTHFVGKKE